MDFTFKLFYIQEFSDTIYMYTNCSAAQVGSSPQIVLQAHYKKWYICEWQMIFFKLVAATDHGWTEEGVAG